MKVNHEKTIISLSNDERLILKGILCIAEELCNDAVRAETVNGILVRAGLLNPRQAAEMRDFATYLNMEC